jgi:hypothetical protein
MNKTRSNNNKFKILIHKLKNYKNKYQFWILIMKIKWNNFKIKKYLLSSLNNILKLKMINFHKKLKNINHKETSFLII